MPLVCGKYSGNFLGGVRSVVIWRATQRPVHVSKRPAPKMCFRWDSRFESTWTIGCGFEQPTSLTWDRETGHHQDTRRHTLHWRGCLLVSAVSSSAAADPSTDSALGAGRLAAGSDTPSELEIQSDFLFPQAAAATGWGIEPNRQRRWMASPARRKGLSPLARRLGLPQLPEKRWRNLKLGDCLRKAHFLLPEHSAKSRGLSFV
jgi:hypothetical protein